MLQLNANFGKLCNILVTSEAKGLNVTQDCYFDRHTTSFINSKVDSCDKES